MKVSATLFSLLIIASFACTNEEATTSASESDVDAARNFIRASLDNDFEKAKAYMLADSTNTEYLEAAQRNRANLTKTDNEKYREASVRIYDTRKLTDSASIVTYSNSYKNQKDSLKIIRTAGQWLVDLKYSFTGNR